MSAIIIYGSKYGTARRYAQELSRRTGVQAKSCEECGFPGDFDTVVYVGALYAGGVLGLKRTFERLPFEEARKVIIATVGLADPQDEQNVCSIRQSLEKQLSREVLRQADVFHLRGGIDYSKLSLAHKTMMGLLYRKAKGLPASQQTADSVAMVETYGKTVDFVDFATLDQIVESLSIPSATAICVCTQGLLKRG